MLDMFSNTIVENWLYSFIEVQIVMQNGCLPLSNSSTDNEPHPLFHSKREGLVMDGGMGRIATVSKSGPLVGNHRKFCCSRATCLHLDCPGNVNVE